MKRWLMSTGLLGAYNYDVAYDVHGHVHIPSSTISVQYLELAFAPDCCFGGRQRISGVDVDLSEERYEYSIG